MDHRWRPALLLGLIILLTLLGTPMAQLWAQEATAADGGSEIDWVEIAIQFAAGLSLFLYGVTVLSDNLQKVAGPRVRSALEMASRNRITW